MKKAGLKILLLGSSGQLGNAFLNLARTEAFPIGWILTGFDREEFDYSEPETLRAKVKLENPDVILNCAAYTAVDQAESEKDIAETVNARAPYELAAIARSLGIPLIHFSSDYVYSGDGERPHVETENPNPSTIMDGRRPGVTRGSSIPDVIF
jgi:dTDP-4-dehydrorhamnose reductase